MLLLRDVSPISHNRLAEELVPEAPKKLVRASILHCNYQINFRPSFIHGAFIIDSFETVFPSELAAGIIGDGVFPRSAIPLERIGTEEDMAGCILFLTSRAGAYCTGNVVVLDGGRLSMLPSTY